MIESRFRTAAAALFRCLVLLSASLLVSCAGSDAVAPPGEWPETIPDQAPLHEYDAVPDEERVDRLELVPDLVIGERPGDTRYSFGEKPPIVVVDGAGRIFVQDPANYRVAVFDAEGEFFYAFGAQGTGPGMFDNPYRRSAMGFLDDRLYIFHKPRRIGFWAPDGTYLGEIDHPRLYWEEAGAPEITPDRQLLLATRTVDNPRSRQLGTIVASYSFGEKELTESRRYLVAPSWVKVSFAATPSGNAFVGSFDIRMTYHQIIALDTDGEVTWISRTEWPYEGWRRADLRIDGRGYIYSLPYFDVSTVERRPVDVYSPTGKEHWALWMEPVKPWLVWQAVSGDFVYGVREDPETYEWQVVRYRLGVPFRE